MKNKSVSSYIPKLLKNITQEYSITANAKNKLDELLYIISHIIINKSINIMELIQKPILSVAIVTAAIEQLFTGDLRKNLLLEIEIERDLIFPKFVFKNQITDCLKQTQKYSPKILRVMTIIIEYIAVEILRMASLQACKFSHIRITVRDIYLSVSYDTEFNQFMTKHNISFMSCGELNMSNDKLLLPKKQFQAMIRETLNEISGVNMKISDAALSKTQHYCEKVIVDILKKTNAFCKTFDKKKISGKELEYIYHFHH